MKFTTLISTLALLVGSVIAQGTDGGVTTSSAVSSIPGSSIPTVTPSSSSPSIAPSLSGTGSSLSIPMMTMSTPTTRSLSTATDLASTSIPTGTGIPNGDLPGALAGMQQVAMGVVAGLVGAAVF